MSKGEQKEEYEKRSRRFREMLKNKPTPGTILEGYEGKSARVTVQRRNGSSVAFTSAIVDPEGTGWYLADSGNGLRVMIDPKDHEKLLKKRKPRVKRLRVLRESIRARALIAELVDESDY